MDNSDSEENNTMLTPLILIGRSRYMTSFYFDFCGIVIFA